MTLSQAIGSADSTSNSRAGVVPPETASRAVPRRSMAAESSPAMRLASVEEVCFAYSNEDGAPYGLSTAAIYADLARPFAEQTMRIRHLPVRADEGTNLYAAWQRRQAGGA